MTTLVWTDDLATSQPQMDQTHREFVELLADFEDALDTPLAATRFDELLAHTEQHFAQEDRWMASLGFAPQNCHGLQHAQVLRALREVAQLQGRPEQGDVLRLILKELAAWFPAHASMMDAALAAVMAERGFDPETGRIGLPREPEAALITGCGGSTCS
jgi:hemerythrin